MMSYERRPDRRPGGRPGGGRPDRPPRDRGGYGDRPRGGGGYQADRPPRDRAERGGYGDRPRGGPGFRPRDDDGGMSIRLDPRRLSALKLLAAEAGVRPGELVTSWVEERVDAARAGKGAGVASPALAALAARVDELSRRVDQMAAAAAPAREAETRAPASETATPAAPSSTPGGAPAKRRGRPPKATAKQEAAEKGQLPATKPKAAPKPKPERRVPLHEEIAAVIRERGPLTAAEIATAIAERGRYAPPRSAHPLDGATVNGRVSNPAYRARFTRDAGRIGLASPE